MTRALEGRISNASEKGRTVNACSFWGFPAHLLVGSRPAPHSQFPNPPTTTTRMVAETSPPSTFRHIPLGVTRSEAETGDGSSVGNWRWEFCRPHRKHEQSQRIKREAMLIRRGSRVRTRHRLVRRRCGQPAPAIPPRCTSKVSAASQLRRAGSCFFEVRIGKSLSRISVLDGRRSASQDAVRHMDRRRQVSLAQCSNRDEADKRIANAGERQWSRESSIAPLLAMRPEITEPSPQPKGCQLASDTL